jgi:hypothetical protein
LLEQISGNVCHALAVKRRHSHGLLGVKHSERLAEVHEFHDRYRELLGGRGSGFRRGEGEGVLDLRDRALTRQAVGYRPVRA